MPEGTAINRRLAIAIVSRSSVDEPSPGRNRLCAAAPGVATQTERQPGSGSTDGRALPHPYDDGLGTRMVRTGRFVLREEPVTSDAEP